MSEKYKPEGPHGPETLSRLQEALRLPKKEEPIPLVVNPFRIDTQREDELGESIPALLGAFMKAQAYRLAMETGRPWEEFYAEILRQPGFVRFDSIPLPLNPESSHGGFKITEVNATRPGGVHLLQLVKDIYVGAGIAEEGQVMIPTIPRLATFFADMIEERDLPPHVGLAWTPEYVAEIEMPAIAEELQRMPVFLEKGITVVAAPRESFREENGFVVDPRGRRVGVFYENAAPPKDTPLGDRSFFRFPQPLRGTAIVNPEIFATMDDKMLMADLWLPEVQEFFNSDELRAVDLHVPRTFLIDSIKKLNDFEKEHDLANYWLKVSYGARASGGRGVYAGIRITEGDRAQIERDLEAGLVYVVQEQIGPREAWYSTTIFHMGEIQGKIVHVDLGVYVLYAGNGRTEVIGLIQRVKDKPPVNLSAGGALGAPIRVN